jgi:hypothetical protein
MGPESSQFVHGQGLVFSGLDDTVLFYQVVQTYPTAAHQPDCAMYGLGD